MKPGAKGNKIDGKRLLAKSTLVILEWPLEVCQRDWPAGDSM